MRIAIAHNDYRNFSGEEAAVAALSLVLKQKGHDVAWLRKSSAGLEDSLAVKRRALVSGIYNPGSRREMADLLETRAIDLVQVQNLYPWLSPSILLACRDQGVPVVMRCPNYRLFCPSGLHLREGRICEDCLGGRGWNCFFHNCEGSLAKSAGYALRGLFASLTGMIRKNVDVFLVLSEFQKKRFMAGGIPAERLAVLPNIAPAVEDSDIPVGDTVSFVGRLSPEKGVADFLTAARRLSGVTFALAGEIEDRPYDKGQAPFNCSFRGFLSGDSLDEFYRQSRIVVVPSVWFEGFPNVIAKAMAMGKPVIASRLGAIPEIVEDRKTGLLFEPGNALDLAQKIDELWHRPELCRQMGEAAKAKARSEYSAERYYERLMAAYAQAKRIVSMKKKFPGTAYGSTSKSLFPHDS